MDHELAVKNQAVERYILGEMEPPEREAFEEHYFACESCAEDVRATSVFVDNARSVLKERHAWPKASRGWAAWFRPAFVPAAVAAACLVVIGYQNLSVIPGLKAPQSPRSMSQVAVLEGPTRSSGAKLRLGDPLRFQVPWDGASSGSVYVELRSGSKAIAGGAVKVPARGEPLDVFFPGQIGTGQYSVVVRAFEGDRPGRELTQSEFDVIP